VKRRSAAVPPRGHEGERVGGEGLFDGRQLLFVRAGEKGQAEVDLLAAVAGETPDIAFFERKDDLRLARHTRDGDLAVAAEIDPGLDQGDGQVETIGTKGDVTVIRLEASIGGDVL
jgi:hypothetical protein